MNKQASQHYVEVSSSFEAWEVSVISNADGYDCYVMELRDGKFMVLFWRSL